MGLKTGGGQIILKSNLDFTIKVLIMLENLSNFEKKLLKSKKFSVRERPLMMSNFRGNGGV